MRIMLAAVVALALGACSDYRNIPPNDIGMLMTPTGFDEKVLTPGQVDLGRENNNGEGNRLVLIQRSGVPIKEAFVGRDASDDKEDHRCLTGDQAPMTLDVRLLLALPDYSTPTGRTELSRILLLGNPQGVQGTTRVLRVTADSVYVQQAQQRVRGRIRQICTQYASFTAALAAYGDEGDTGFTRKVERAIARELVDSNVPLHLVSATVSNMKPDPTVTDAIAAKLAADKRKEAIQVITDFLAEDPTGGRQKVYNLQVLQEIVAKANANGHNTIFMTDISAGLVPTPVPANR